jgi:DNA-binding transcriptional regulator GbsR (MarR family)
MNAITPPVPAGEFIERLGRLAEREGLPRTAGRMMGLLMLHGQPLSIDEIAERLSISRASVSTNGRLLESLEIASRVTHAGDRRDYLQIGPDPCSSLLSLGVRRLKDMRRALHEMRTASQEVRDGRSLRQRLQHMERFYDLVIARAETTLSTWQRGPSGRRRDRCLT